MSAGKWLPLYSSQELNNHPFDIWSFTHILHGFMYFMLFIRVYRFVFLHGLILSIVAAIMWEAIENTENFIHRYRAYGDTFEGDSYHNILGDVIASLVGYLLRWLFSIVRRPYIGIIWFLLSEVILYYYMYDNLMICFLSTFQLISNHNCFYS